MIKYPDFVYQYSWEIIYDEESTLYCGFCETLNCGVQGDNFLDLYLEIIQITNDLKDLNEVYGEFNNQYLIFLN